MIYTRNGEPFDINALHLIGDVQYPAGWFYDQGNRDAFDVVAVAEEASAPAVLVPQQVTMRQARLALLAAGLLSQVDAAIDALPSPNKDAARIEWDYSATVERTWPLVAMLGAALGLDDTALDDLFITAAVL